MEKSPKPARVPVVDDFLSTVLASPSGTHRRALLHHFIHALKVDRTRANKKQNTFFNKTLLQDLHIQTHFADDTLRSIRNEDLLFDHVFLEEVNNAFSNSLHVLGTTGRG